MTPTRRALAGLLAAPAAAALATPFLARPARAAPTRITAASLFGEDKPETLIWRRVAERLDALAPGRFEVRVVGNAALGGEREVAEGLRLGSVQASLSTVSVMTAWVPEGGVLDLPFVFRDREHLARVLAGPLGAELKGRYEAQGFVVLGYVNYGARHLLGKAPLPTPAAVAGRRIRVIQSPVHAALWTAYGAHPTPIPIPETYNALQTGVVDCMDLTKSAYAGFRLHEVVPVLTETGHIWSAGVAQVGAPLWRRLNAADREALAAAVAEGAAAFDRLMVEDEAASMRRVAAEGGRTHPAEDRPAWEAGARKVWETFAPRLGGLARVEAIAREG